MNEQNGFAARALSAAGTVPDSRAFITGLVDFYASTVSKVEILMTAHLFETPGIDEGETPIMRASRAYDCWLHVVSMRTEQTEPVAWACKQGLDDSEMEDSRLLERLLIPTVLELDSKQFITAVVTATNEYRHGLAREVFSLTD